MQSNFSRTLLIISLIAVAAITRFIPHPFNFTAIGAMALFGGATMTDKRLALVLPLLAMLISDFFIGFHEGMWLVYAAFLVVGFIGIAISKNIKLASVITGSLAGSCVFYLLTNFAFFYPETMYPHTVAGILQSYVMAIPFFTNALAGDLFFNGVLFGSFYLVSQRIPAFR